ncbi:TetR/AcrR family transcriptional regulator [Rhodococcus kronopolitis]|uniref:TetR/AcrR family transcriptional regulator n=1 Tax=Rhodococcus kronopolitis TaxID=1460226 RepID=A0ABV9FV88_9NOCA
MSTEATRDALVSAGIELLEETGSADLGLRAIARRAGVSHGAPRRWFPTHRLLLAAIAEAGLRDLSATLAAAEGESGATIGQLAAAYVEFAARRPAMFTLIFRHDLLEGSGTNLRAVSRPLFERIVTLVEHATGARDPEVAAAALWAGIHGIAVLSTTGSLGAAAPRVDVAELIERVVTNAVR